MYTIKLSKSLDPDQARQNVGPVLVPYVFQMLSADDTSTYGQIVKKFVSVHWSLYMFMPVYVLWLIKRQIRIVFKWVLHVLIYRKCVESLI